MASDYQGAKSGLSFRISGPKAGFFANTLPSYIKGLTTIEGQLLADIESIINDGILKNFHTLSSGNSVRQAGTSGGFALSWLQTRSPWTIVARTAFQLPPYAPFLNTRSGIGRKRGKLLSGYEKGGILVRRPGVGAQWRPRTSSVQPLMRVHEKGGKRLGTSKAFPGLNSIRIPARPSIFWSDEMAKKVIRRMAVQAKHKARDSRIFRTGMGPL